MIEEKIADRGEDREKSYKLLNKLLGMKTQVTPLPMAVSDQHLADDWRTSFQ